MMISPSPSPDEQSVTAEVQLIPKKSVLNDMHDGELNPLTEEMQARCDNKQKEIEEGMQKSAFWRQVKIKEMQEEMQEKEAEMKAGEDKEKTEKALELKSHR